VRTAWNRARSAAASWRGEMLRWLFTVVPSVIM